MNPTTKLALALTLLAASVTPALAAWPNLPTVDLPVCAAAGNQYFPTTVSDGDGGAIVTWYDDRSGTSSDIFAQRIEAF